MSQRIGGIGPIPVPMPSPQLRRGDVRLRALVPGDVDTIARACTDPAIRRYTRIPSDYGRADAWAFVAGAESRRREGHSLNLAITDRPDGGLCGVVGLVVDPFDAARAEIGYWTHPEHRGRGLATAALFLLSRWALGPGGFARLDLTASTANVASLRVAAHSGFVREGTERAAWPTPDGRDDMALFSLLPSDLDGEGGVMDRRQLPMEG
jgi:RimJ/RimL family protein N-acetyltransferase